MKRIAEPKAGEMWEVQPGVIGEGQRLAVLAVNKPVLHRPWVDVWDGTHERRMPLDDRWGRGLKPVRYSED